MDSTKNLTVATTTWAPEKPKPPFEVTGYDEFAAFEVRCSCDPTSRYSRTWYLIEGHSFEFKCGNPACGKRFHLELQVQWREVTEGK